MCVTLRYVCGMFSRPTNRRKQSVDNLFVMSKSPAGNKPKPLNVGLNFFPNIKIPFFYLSKTTFRLLLFLVHFTFSIILVAMMRGSPKCPRQNYWYSTSDTMISWAGCKGYTMKALAPPNEWQNCTMGEMGMCIHGNPPAATILYDMDDFTIGGTVHPFACLVIFEYLTASFALIYLTDALVEDFTWFGQNSTFTWIIALTVATAWNFTLGLITFLTNDVVPFNHRFFFVIVFFVVTFLVQAWFAMQIGNNDEPQKKESLRMQVRYLEYAQTASVLYISVVQVTSFAGVSGTAIQCGFMAILVCNVLGYTLQHYALAAIEENTLQTQKLFTFLHLLGSWAAFFIAWAPVFQAWGDLAPVIQDIPDVGARFSIWFIFINLLIWYLAFGIVPTLLVYLPALQVVAWDEKMEIMTTWIFDILSAIVKILIAITIMTSDVFQPQATNGVENCRHPLLAPIASYAEQCLLTL